MVLHSLRLISNTFLDFYMQRIQTQYGKSLLAILLNSSITQQLHVLRSLAPQSILTVRPAHPTM